MMSAISEVLETMFFESLDFEARDSGGQSWYCESTVGFSNEGQSREISFRFTEAFAKLIAANFLGSGEDVISREEVADVMRELANMVGGNYLGRLPNEDWRLGIPEFKVMHGPGGGESSGLSLMYMGELVGVVFLRSF
jgi:CheY-specific phosphatase CheX